MISPPDLKHSHVMKRKGDDSMSDKSNHVLASANPRKTDSLLDRSFCNAQMPQRRRHSIVIDPEDDSLSEASEIDHSDHRLSSRKILIRNSSHLQQRPLDPDEVSHEKDKPPTKPGHRRPLINMSSTKPRRSIVSTCSATVSSSSGATLTSSGRQASSPQLSPRSFSEDLSSSSRQSRWQDLSSPKAGGLELNDHWAEESAASLNSSTSISLENLQLSRSPSLQKQEPPSLSPLLPAYGANVQAPCLPNRRGKMQRSFSSSAPRDERGREQVMSASSQDAVERRPRSRSRDKKGSPHNHQYSTSSTSMNVDMLAVSLRTSDLDASVQEIAKEYGIDHLYSSTPSSASISTVTSNESSPSRIIRVAAKGMKHLYSGSNNNAASNCNNFNQSTSSEMTHGSLPLKEASNPGDPPAPRPQRYKIKQQRKQQQEERLSRRQRRRQQSDPVAPLDHFAVDPPTPVSQAATLPRRAPSPDARPRRRSQSPVQLSLVKTKVAIVKKKKLSTEGSKKSLDGGEHMTVSAGSCTSDGDANTTTSSLSKKSPKKRKVKGTKKGKKASSLDGSARSSASDSRKVENRKTTTNGKVKCCDIRSREKSSSAPVLDEIPASYETLLGLLPPRKHQASVDAVSESQCIR